MTAELRISDPVTGELLGRLDTQPPERLAETLHAIKTR